MMLEFIRLVALGTESSVISPCVHIWSVHNFSLRHSSLFLVCKYLLDLLLFDLFRSLIWLLFVLFPNIETYINKLYHFIDENKIKFHAIKQFSEMCIAAWLWSEVVDVEQSHSKTSTTFYIFPRVVCAPVSCPCASSHSLPLFPERSNHSSKLSSNSTSLVLYRFHCVEEGASAGFPHEPLPMFAWLSLLIPLGIAHVLQSRKCTLINGYLYGVLALLKLVFL